MVYDYIVIGAGPSGATLSMYLKDASKNILCIYKDRGTLEYGTFKNYYGYPSISGKDLFDNGLVQLKERDVEIINSEVISIDYGMNSFDCVLSNNEIYSAKNIIIATGLSKTFLKKEFKDYLGKGLSLCAMCDGPLYKNKKVFVTGKAPYLEEMIKELSHFTKDIEVVDLELIKELKGNELLEEIVLNNNDSIKTNNLFFADKLSNQVLSSRIGIFLDDGYIKVNDLFETNIKGIYAIGDAIKGYKQIVKASNDGLALAKILLK